MSLRPSGVTHTRRRTAIHSHWNNCWEWRGPNTVCWRHQMMSVFRLPTYPACVWRMPRPYADRTWSSIKATRAYRLPWDAPPQVVGSVTPHHTLAERLPPVQRKSRPRKRPLNQIGMPPAVPLPRLHHQFTARCHRGLPLPAMQQPLSSM